ncbi:MAG: nucleoside monophosphate kinase [Bryobacteraceae bacterium]|nr:nucleoside monophosphate kinase [Bryobacteraceae bacterium]
MTRLVPAQPSPKRVILMLGPPAAGKTTQSQTLKSALGLPSVSMSDVLRKEGGGKGGLNKSLRAQIASGDLVSDEVANGLIRKRITQKDCERGFILDGYPFTAKQAEYFEALLTELGLPRPKVIHLSIGDMEAYQRTQTRGRVDDSPANAERRIVEYRREAQLLLARYPEAVTVDATKSPRDVAASIRKALGY